MTRLIIHAPNIHQGGGAVLLTELLTSIPAYVDAVALIDARFAIPAQLDSHVQIKSIPPSLKARFMAELTLRRLAGKSDQVLCFGNLPPLFRLKAPAAVFVQNRYLVDRQAPLSALPWKIRLRLRVEAMWLKKFSKNADRLLVQTPSMRDLVQSYLGISAQCFPFVSAAVRSSTAAGRVRAGHRFDFVYVASGESHKNHTTLIDAWKLLAEEGLFPTLALTLSPTAAPELCTRLAQDSAAYGLRITNLGVLPHPLVLALYRESAALIYPSSFESFGLPLLEAKLAGLPVLAPELDYVRDVLDPDATFDPRSSVSISRAVKRFLEVLPPPVKPEGAEGLIEQLLSMDVS